MFFIKTLILSKTVMDERRDAKIIVMGWPRKIRAIGRTAEDNSL